MHGPSSDTSARIDPDDLTWRRVLASYAMMAVLPFALWAVSDPVGAGFALTAGAGAVVTAQHARRLARCVDECRGLAFDLPGSVDVAVTWEADSDAC
jgi:hypothetical protein